ncbi:MAG: tRNA threonylcarbamoyladenosine dehydratase [Clostridia bacterium]
MRFSRTELILGKDAIERLYQAKVAVFGLGGVGAYVAEALARSGVGGFLLVDDDKVCISNINRQLIALDSTIGKYKVDVMRDRILDIHKNAIVETRKTFYGNPNKHEFDFTGYSYIADAIDTVSSKLTLAEEANRCNVPIISAMGAGNKLDASAFEVADIYKTSVCPLARVMRTELRKRGIKSLKVVYSKEPPLTPEESDEISYKSNAVCPSGVLQKCAVRRQIPGSTAFAPPVAGLIMAGEIVKDIVRGITKN